MKTKLFIIVNVLLTGYLICAYVLPKHFSTETAQASETKQYCDLNAEYIPSICFENELFKREYKQAKRSNNDDSDSTAVVIVKNLGGAGKHVAVGIFDITKAIFGKI